MRILRNFSYLTLGRLLGDVFTFVFFIVLARTYGQGGMGHYSFALALTGVLSTIADFGLYNRSVKDISRDRAGVASYYGLRIAVRLALCAAAFLALFLVVVADLRWFQGELRWVILLIGMYQILQTLVDGFGATFVAHEDMHVSAALELSLRATTALSGTAIALSGASLVWTVATLPVVTALHVGISYVCAVKRFGVMRISATLREGIQILRDAWPYAGHSLLAQFLTRGTLVFVGFILGAAAAGVFNAAYRVVLLILVIPVFAGLAVLPAASHLYAETMDGFTHLCRSALRIAVLLAMPMAVGMWLIAPRLVHALYGTEFLDSVEILRWLACVILLVFSRVVVEFLLIACDRQKKVTAVQLAVVCLGVPLHYALITGFGLAGAAATMVLLEVLAMLAMVIQLARVIGPLGVGRRVFASITASTAFFLPLYHTDPPLVVTIPVAIIIYLAVLLLFRDLRREEFRLVSSWIFPASAAEKAAG